MADTTQMNRRPEVAAMQGLIGQVLLSGGMVVLGYWMGSDQALHVGFIASTGVLPWIALWRFYRLGRLEHEQALHVEALERETPEDVPAGARPSISGMPPRRSAHKMKLVTAQSELASIREGRVSLLRMGIPAVGVITALFLLGVAWMSAGTAHGVDEEGVVQLSGDPLLGVVISAGLAFVGFILARYVGRLADVPQWSSLGSGAGYMMGAVDLCLIAMVGFSLAHFRVGTGIQYLSWLVHGAAFLVGVEIAVFLVLEQFRPRKKDEVPRPAFDSRLLGLLSSPESVGTAVQETLDYQFGFKVSKNWFLQLLGRTAWPMVLISGGTLMLVSCIIVVEPHQQALRLRLGEIVGTPLGPGIHLKAPWPLEQARKFDVLGVRTVRFGAHKEGGHGHEETEEDKDGPILWTNMHGLSSDKLMIVAPPGDLLGQRDAREDDRRPLETHGPAVSLVAVEALVEYRVRDLMLYVRHSVDPDRYFTQLGSRALAREVLKYDADALIGLGRGEASANLQRELQALSDQARLGLEILYVGIPSVHPPQEVAGAFEETVSARQERETAIQGAEQYAIRLMTEATGTRDHGKDLLEGITGMESLIEQGASQDQVDRQRQSVERLLSECSGEVAARIAQAWGYRWTRENSERGKVERFEKELLLHDVAPLTYQTSYYLGILEMGLSKARKYMFLGDRDKLVVRFDFKEAGNIIGQMSNPRMQAITGGPELEGLEDVFQRSRSEP